MQGLFINYNDVQKSLERYKNGREIIKNGSYEQWNK
jgi:hypothetical protein